MPTDGRTQRVELLEQLSTERLLDLLQADFDAADEGDDELTLQILEVIEKREHEMGNFCDVDAAWRDFQKYFNTPDGEGRSLYPTRDPELKTVSEDCPSRQKRFLRKFLPVAVAALVALSTMAAAQAFGFDIFGALARWTDETFHFIAGTEASAMGVVDPASDALRQSVQDALDSAGIDLPAPSWYPEGTVLARDIDVIVDKDKSLVLCDFLCDDIFFNMNVQQQRMDIKILRKSFEKDPLEVEEYPSNGRLFYIMSDLNKRIAICSESRTILMIDGSISLEDLKMLIDSIGE